MQIEQLQRTIFRVRNDLTINELLLALAEQISPSEARRQFLKIRELRTELIRCESLKAEVSCVN